MCFAALWWGGDGIETSFDLRFEYEDPASLLAGQTTVGGPRLRWNTQSVVAGFGVERGARVELQVTDLQVAGANDATEVPVVFTLYDNDQWRAYAVLKLREVHIRSNFVLCHYPAAMRFTIPPPDSLAELPWTLLFDVRKASQFTLQAQVCDDASVNVSGRVSMVNFGYDGALSEHLGVQELGLRPLYKVLFVVYLAAMVLWILDCNIWRRNVPKICYVFQAALQAKALSVALKLAFYSERSSHGQANTPLDIAQDVGESATSAALLGVSVLGSLGWSITRARLSRRETLSLLLLAVIYLVVSFNKALCRPTDAPQCRGFVLSEYALQSMMMLGVIVALNFTIAQLKLAASYERWNCFVTPLTYMKLEQFQRFRFVFLGYLLTPTFLLLVNLLVVTPPGYWRYAWVNTLLAEVTTLVIVTNIGLVVRPVDTYIYSRIARSTASDTPNHESPDPIEPPPLEAPQADPVRPQTTDTTTTRPAAPAPVEYPSANTDTMMSGLAAIESNR
ncbi:hypothetical protein PF005_g14545 [Phytophthora fragariae]|uniref:GOST seven transmembrane domain-containing protein n=1 Tax=Phytophthora fragariae TaxID=53985 RepID=A0A6A3RW63_9STRA|nr:hypothetical protein PF009_g14661 [Phytophthora fragariae]KAE9001256.1 hypothetical protein PF011_g13828 [Phytophthora fragariae]KAE9101380.1 hypothetical protein PF007_g15165 [Phytophthora fragariae]KAE9104031.1 hypothetical protein PF010_g13528 [Phytophthora fragariae]KAE9138319.1 hypothetical protein PF006_g13968 [Phytophthora fragariae]